jgi:hypothetical protein
LGKFLVPIRPQARYTNDGSPHETVDAELARKMANHAIRNRGESEVNLMAARFRDKYHNEIRESLKKELGIENPMAIPRLEKIVINMGLGEATQNVKIMDPLVADLASIAGQKPVITKAKKSIAQFKLREGMPIGAMVTTSVESRPKASTAAATTRSVCATSSFSPKSITRRSISSRG